MKNGSAFSPFSLSGCGRRRQISAIDRSSDIGRAGRPRSFLCSTDMNEEEYAGHRRDECGRRPNPRTISHFESCSFEQAGSGWCQGTGLTEMMIESTGRLKSFGKSVDVR
jgi:hypothetical protein